MIQPSFVGHSTGQPLTREQVASEHGWQVVPAGQNNPSHKEADHG